MKKKSKRKKKSSMEKEIKEQEFVNFNLRYNGFQLTELTGISSHIFIHV